LQCCQAQEIVRRSAIEIPGGTNFGLLKMEDCGEHHARLFIDMYFRGPELPIGNCGWTLADGVSPAEKLDDSADCPYCGKELRTPASKQCRFCMMDWHDPKNVFRKERKTK
jgi:hypothetical protein